MHGQNNSHTENSTDDGALADKLRHVPLNSVPDEHPSRRKSGEDDKKALPEVRISNEIDVPAGRFGWCIACRNTADLYCKDTRHPVCSAECKKKHIVEFNSLDGPPVDSLPNYTSSKEASLAVADAYHVFKAIVKLCIEDNTSKTTASQGSGPNDDFLLRTNIIGL